MAVKIVAILQLQWNYYFLSFFAEKNGKSAFVFVLNKPPMSTLYVCCLQFVNFVWSVHK